MAEYKLISADSHVVEPRNMWSDYCEPAFKDRAPRMVKNPEGMKKGEYFFIEGIEAKSVAGDFSAGIPPEELPEHSEDTLDDCRPGAYIPSERMTDLELDGVEAEVIYTTQGFKLFHLTDAPLQQAVFRAYNNWLSEFCSYDPQRLIGLGLISLLDVEEGIAELKRCAKLSLRGGVIMASPPDDISYGDPMYEPFWAVADDLRMPLSLHVLTGHGPESRKLGRFKNNHYLGAMSLIHEVQRSFTEIIFSGVLARHPNLKFVSAENDIGWMPHFIYRADHWYEKGKYSRPTDLTMPPSDYARRQMFVTFMDDPVGLSLSHFYGEDNFGWASDYPHGQSTFPDSQEVVDENFAGISEEIKRKITRTNTINLYDIKLAPA